MDALSGVHLLQRVVYPRVAPDRGRRAAGCAVAELHRDADGGLGVPGGEEPERHHQEQQGQIHRAGGRRGAHQGRRRVLHDRRQDGRIDSAGQWPQDAAAVVAWGSCASNGCVQAAKPNPTGATPIHKLVNKPVINVPGCPPIADVMMSVVTHLLVLGQVPELDSLGRPKEFYGRRVHDTCYRRANYDAGLFVESWDDENARKGYCLYKMGCKGPVTYNACSVVRWNEGTSYPIQSGHGCIGCSEDRLLGQRPVLSASVVVPGVRHREHGRHDRHRGWTGDAGRSCGARGGDQHTQAQRDRGSTRRRSKGVVRSHGTQ